MCLLKKTFFIILFSLVGFNHSGFAQSSKFKVVLDAGHGGHDKGASYHGFVESKIALDVTLKVGNLLEKEPGIQVIYTRDRDVFLELNERANVANSNKASVFVSLHCNANANTSAEGYETYVMGMHRNASNLEVAKKENEVVTLEKDYKVKYNGYDPKNPETAIGTTIMQEEYMDNSISLASRVQNGMATNFGRKDRRVKQAGFLVLREIAMPRILIEMGFISNRREGNYLNSQEGQNEVAQGIANAIISYKKEYYGTEENSATTPTPAEKTVLKVKEKKESVAKKENTTEPAPTPVATEIDASGVIFKVQISASSKLLPITPSNFKGLDNISVTNEGGTLYKYMYGNTNNYDEAKQNLAEARAKGFEGAYIVAFKNGKKISVQEALK